MESDREIGKKRVDEQAVYAEIGRYVVCFQALENELVLICWLCWDPPNGPEGRRDLADLSFSRLVGMTSERVHELLCRKRLEDTEFRQRWRGNFDVTMDCCRSVARERNAILHSTYIHIEGGDELMGIVRSEMRRDPEGSGVTFDQEWLGPTSFEEPLRRLVETYLAVCHCKAQLLHWA